MERGKIVLLRLYSGDYVMGEIGNGDGVGPSDGRYVLSNPRLFSMMPTMTGGIRAGFQPLCPFSESSNKLAEIREDQVMVTVGEDELPKEMVNAYNSHVTGIRIASASETAAVNGASDIII